MNQVIIVHGKIIIFPWTIKTGLCFMIVALATISENE